VTPAGDALVAGGVWSRHCEIAGAALPLAAPRMVDGSHDAGCNFAMRLGATGPAAWLWRNDVDDEADGELRAAQTADGDLVLAVVQGDGRPGGELRVLRLDRDTGTALMVARLLAWDRLRATALSTGMRGEVVVAGSFQGELQADVGLAPLASRGRPRAFVLWLPSPVP
jgi:hypothetical protein